MRDLLIELARGVAFIALFAAAMLLFAWLRDVLEARRWRRRLRRLRAETEATRELLRLQRQAGIVSLCEVR